MPPSTDAKIAKASLVLIGASLCGYAASLIKEIIVAKYFGITPAMDAFYAALTFPNLINNVLLSTFGAVFIPVFVRLRLEDRRQANRIASVTINYLFVFLLFGSILLSLFAPYAIRYGFHGLGPGTAAMAVRLLRIICLTIVLFGLAGALSGILNAYEHFLWPAVSQIFITGVIILTLLAGFARWGIYALAYGLCAGLLVQVLFLVPVARSRGYRHRFDFDCTQAAARQMLYLAPVYLMAIVAAQMNIVVDRVMASYLARGSIAALGYAEKFVQVPIIVFTGALSTAVFPFFSRQVAENRIEELKRSLARSIRTGGVIFIPITLLLVLFAKPLLAVLLERGAFGPQATELTSSILVCYSFQLFFYTTAMLLARVYLALQDIATLVKVAFAGVAMNIIFNLLFIRIVRPPAAGIALSTSFVQLITMSLFFFFLRRKTASLHGRYILRGLVKVTAGAAAMGAVAYLVFFLSGGLSVYSPRLSELARVAVAVASGAVMFAAAVRILGVEELGSAIALVRSRLGGRGG